MKARSADPRGVPERIEQAVDEAGSRRARGGATKPSDLPPGRLPARRSGPLLDEGRPGRRGSATGSAGGGGRASRPRGPSAASRIGGTCRPAGHGARGLQPHPARADQGDRCSSSAPVGTRETRDGRPGPPTPSGGARAGPPWIIGADPADQRAAVVATVGAAGAPGARRVLRKATMSSWSGFGQGLEPGDDVRRPRRRGGRSPLRGSWPGRRGGRGPSRPRPRAAGVRHSLATGRDALARRTAGRGRRARRSSRCSRPARCPCRGAGGSSRTP